MLKSITWLFWSMYHTTTCCLMLDTCSHKWYPKIHPDAPRNACGVPTITRQVYRVITTWYPTQVTIHHNHLVFIMSHITADSIVQIVSWFMSSIIRNVQIFTEVFAKITDWMSPTLVLTKTWPRLPFSPIQTNLRANLTQISPYLVKPDFNLTS
jgi:hypothetical protein